MGFFCVGEPSHRVPPRPPTCHPGFREAALTAGKGFERCVPNPRHSGERRKVQSTARRLTKVATRSYGATFSGTTLLVALALPWTSP
jgi:hypothetical protein